MVSESFVTKSNNNQLKRYIRKTEQRVVDYDGLNVDTSPHVQLEHQRATRPVCVRFCHDCGMNPRAVTETLSFNLQNRISSTIPNPVTSCGRCTDFPSWCSWYITVEGMRRTTWKHFASSCGCSQQGRFTRSKVSAFFFFLSAVTLFFDRLYSEM